MYIFVTNPADWLPYHTHTHTHPFNGPFSRTTRVGRYQKGKTNLDCTEARDSEWQWHQLGHMQVCTSLQTDNHASTSPLSFYRPDALPAAQPTASRHWRQCHTDKIIIIIMQLTRQNSGRKRSGTLPCRRCLPDRLPCPGTRHELQSDSAPLTTRRSSCPSSRSTPSQPDTDLATPQRRRQVRLKYEWMNE